ncbi:MAG: bifunctional aconitate hydratase 2/2-methylisocitrate dehydratase [Bdellovibrionales bacterium RIFOXYD12_FULL_39_22]|nr:MAG: bifunctional aconitate hydratase 2/2-methylisocitrate dehydratase [Bdellovibrionales bacterium RIFOXYB1_FULL_39_21]OFZ45017.1 MAG: bifunctional aconitate hydratase 2/2-methylisocitrate dehydratase [Bdellovibrionales bacterium RIFOXYC12_FULL_39_17]OFZ49455.1 MAG: bifunctional aconitate hydratase 2/2-methylisocitrate dehydratase [Bdellovibrionales bacterium RIFOXYC1_FULL_39_130]OFZ77194.1 MAG: bifunctional aconitate hydratase 2/2-methylisocitrate dehydratase [Bdellovibrionales bacterium RI
MSNFFENYYKHVEERKKQGIPPLALTDKQMLEVVELLQNIPSGKDNELLDLISNRVNPGVDPAAKVKADFLLEVIHNNKKCKIISPEMAIELLGHMIGGYNLEALLSIVKGKDDKLAQLSANALKKMPLSVNIFEEINSWAKTGSKLAKEIITSWANAEWFTSRPSIPNKITNVIYKVNGEINTDDFSPASHAFTRADIPLHALSMGGSLFPQGPADIKKLNEKHKLPVCFVGDVVGTGSSRKSACNSLLWFIGEEIKHVPNKKSGGVILGSTIAPIFFNTAEDSGALPIQVDVTKLTTGQVVNIYPLKGEICDEKDKVISKFSIRPVTLLDEYKAGGRVPLIIGKQLTEMARSSLKLSSLESSGIFTNPDNPTPSANQGYTLAQKIVGKACGMKGVLPGTACLPKMTSVGSQDTTGPMTASELVELACLKFNADLVMQSFCHTAAYPKPSDVKTHNSLPSFISKRGGISLRPGDGVIHSWLNRLLIPDTVGTGGDSHTRFPIGISFPAGSGLVAFAAAIGSMPLDMPESVLVRFKGKLQRGITLRDVVNMIPYQAIKQGLLTVAKENKKNIFAGRILEMEGLPNLTVEQAFELTDASAERSAAAATIKLNRDTIEEFLHSNVALMQAMIENGYEDKSTLQKRINDVNDWIKNGKLMEADHNAEYAAVIDINLDEMKEPILACPNDPDDVRPLSAVAGDKVHDVFIGSCMTNIGHFRATAAVLKSKGFAKTKLWLCPPTKMDSDQLKTEGLFSVFSEAGARIEIPGCSLCMGNQARVDDGVTVFSTSTRNFNNRMGKDAKVYLGSSELAAVVALLGKIPTLSEYLEISLPNIQGKENDIYKYLNFHQMNNFKV